MPVLTFAVGDIHGCLDKLDRLLATCAERVGKIPARHVFLGDYIDRGPNSRGVIERLMRMQAERPRNVVCLRGNHEQLALDAHRDPAAMPLWLENKGATTMRNYPHSGGRMSDDHLAWLDALPFCHDDGLRFFVHAGIDLTLPLDAQQPETMIWMREPFLSRCDRVDVGRFIVHGHTPQPTGAPDLRKRRVNLDTAAVMGGPLTAALFDDVHIEPLEFLTSEDG
jgi:serine/threonine protein phosphatase 1